MRRNYKKRPVGKRNYKKKRPARRAKSALVKTIKKVINSEAETKNRIFRYGSVDIGPGILTASDWQNVIPPIPQVGQPVVGGGVVAANNNTRIGNAIKPSSCRLTVMASLNNEIFTVNVLCTIYVFKVKGVTNYNQAVSTLLREQQQADQFLDTGDGSYKAYAGEGQIWDHLLPVNPTSFTLLHKRTFQLSKGAGINEGSPVIGTLANVSPQGGANQCYKECTFNIPLPATLKYAEDADFTGGVLSDNNPNNCAIFWAIGYSNISQETLEYTNNPVVVSAMSNIYFKDM